MHLQQQTLFRRELDRLPSWTERAKKIEGRIKETNAALVSRNEKLLALRSDFDALTIGFWRDNTPLAVTACIAGTSGIVFILIDPRAQLGRARTVAAILGREQQPFWLTSPAGNIALSNLELTPPQNAQWLTAGRTTFVFLKHLAARFTIDGFTCDVIWQNPLLSDNSDSFRAKEGLFAPVAAEILKDLLAIDRYRQMVSAFVDLASLETNLAFLSGLKTEAEAGLAQELREAEQRVQELREAQQKAPGSRQAKEEPKVDILGQPVQKARVKASWDTLIIPKSLRENLQAYCRILRDYEAYRAEG